MTYNKKFDDDLDREIIECLEGDQILNLKLKKGGSSGGVYREGICPNCGRKSIWVSAEKPWHLKCDHEGSCGYTTTIKERYPELFENFSKKHPPTDDDPKATARAYMKRARGFHSPTVHSWYEQGIHGMKNGQAAATVRFQLCDGMTWERIIDKANIEADGGGKTRIKKQDNSKTYSDKCWIPPTLEINAGDTVYIVEGVFCAIAMYLAGYKAVAAISSGNFPRDLIKEHQNRIIKWRLAYDDEPGAHKKICHYAEELKSQNQDFEVLLTGNKDDWNDAYQAEKLNDAYLDQCMWRGRIFIAETPTKKAYALACWKKGLHHEVIEFDNRLYSVKFSANKYSEANDNSSELEWGFSYDPFKQATTVKNISNCVPRFEYIQKEPRTGERFYYFSIQKAGDDVIYRGAVKAGSTNDVAPFKTALKDNTNGCVFNGTAKDLARLDEHWMEGKLPEVRTVEFIGYDHQSGAYIFPDFAYYKGRLIKPNKNEYFDINGNHIKTVAEGIDLVRKDTFNGDFINDYHQAFSHCGISTLAFFTSSLFTDQIKAKYKSAPIYELTGERGAGKSTQVRFCWKLLGRDDWEGVDLLSLSPNAYNREFAIYSNLPMVVIESDRAPQNGNAGRPSRSVEWDEFKKHTDFRPIIDGKAARDYSNKTVKRTFLGALLAVQNASIQASPAMMSRIHHEHADRAHHNDATHAAVERLQAMTINDLCGYLSLVLSKEAEYLDHFHRSYDSHFSHLKSCMDFDSRLISFHAQMMAAIDCLSLFFPQWSQVSKDNALEHVVKRAQARQRRLNSDHPLITKFWDTYDYVNERLNDRFQNKGESQLNHSLNPNQIAVNLNEFQDWAREYNQEFIDKDELMSLLPTSQHHTFITEGKNPRQIRSSQRKGKRTKCWLFQRNITEKCEDN